ncbi:hypothetical protein C0J52_08941 [Blattella germanica]|nr:hypothetical protein C0J52_08941 [Blattella germanica]
MTTESGSKEKLHCTSHLRDGKYVGFLNRKLDLQELALNLPTEHFAMAYNGSYCTYMFKSGLLKPRSVVTFLIHCQIKAVIKFEVKLQLQLEKTKIIELPIVGSVGYPNVILKPDQIKLRRMSADSFDSVKMTIKNRGTTLAKVKFLLHNHNEYFLSKSSDIYAPKDNCREEYSLDPGKNVTLYLHFIPYDIYFQPLPLEFESTTTIYLTASNYYCKSKITANIVPGQYDEKKVAEKLSVMFLSGYNIYPSDTPLVLPVKLIFKSQEPVSFKTQFCFSDTLGHNCYVTLIATADNCSLTTYAFLTQADAIQTPSEDSQTSSPESADGNVSMASSRQASRLTSLSDESEALDTRSFRVQVHRKLSKRSGPIEFSSMTLTGDSIVGSAIDSGQQEASQTEEEESDRNVHYPRFPAEDDDSYRAHFLNKTLQAVESWLYDEGPIPDVNEERIAYFHKLYSHLIDFLSNNGGCLAHVKPCYLLSYNDYVVYMNRDVVDPKNPSIKLVPCDSCINIYGSKSSENSDMSHYFDKSTLKLSSYKEFMSYSKQYWLDLILQLHKVTVLSKITVDSIRFKKHDIYVNLEMGSSQLQISNTRMSLKETESNPENERKCNLEEDEEKDVRNKATNMYNQQESIILLWLEEKYKQQRITLSTSSQAMRPKGIPPLKEVTNFEADLSDGLVYAAVTAAYCPYLAKAFFNDLFPNPLSEEESFHNAIQVTKAWQAIKLGFTIAPEDIVYPNSVKMLLLSAYLYEILPSFTTKSVISFQSELSREEKKTLTLANPSQQKVTYGVIILGDPLGLFKIKNETVISVKKNSSSSLVLAYDARMVGSFQVYNKLWNLAFDLVAKASPLTVSEVFVLSPPLYKPHEESLKITPPYKQEAEYNIYITEEEPTTEETSIGLRLTHYLSENDSSTQYEELAGTYNKSVTYNVNCNKTGVIVCPEKFHIPDTCVKLTLKSEDNTEVRIFEVSFTLPEDAKPQKKKFRGKFSKPSAPNGGRQRSKKAVVVPQLNKKRLRRKQLCKEASVAYVWQTCISIAISMRRTSKPNRLPAAWPWGQVAAMHA